MKRLVPFLLAIVLSATVLRVPAATAASLSPLEVDELETSYNRVSSEFYKKVDPQMLLDGARSNLIAFLQKNGIANPAVPAIRASEDTGYNLHELDKEVGSVVSQYGARFGARALTYEAISGMLSAVKDKYTVFLTPKQYAQLNEGLDGGNFGGVGISIRVDDQTKLLQVIDVLPGMPAEKAGVLPNDVILTVDGKSTKGLTSEEDSKMLRGRKGTAVRLGIERGGQPLSAPITIVRDTIHQASVFARLLPNGIGYARLTVFGRNTAVELAQALSRLEMQGARAYVLDLRDNGGGYLDAAIEVASKFVPTGPIVSVEARGGSNTRFDAENTAIAPRPLAVLVNKYTASASEIASGAIQDNRVGALIGTRTYGKGVVQTIFPLPDGSAVKITTARYLTPNGRDINTVGIQPDIVSEENKNARPGEPASDTQLQAAITYLQGKIAQLGT